MKKIIALFSLMFALSSGAALAQNEPFNVKMEGTVQFSQSYTITCMAIGCPPSESYFYVNLADARASNGTIHMRDLALYNVATKPGVNEKPKTISFQGTNLHEGDVVIVDAEVRELSFIREFIVVKVNSIVKK